MKSCLVNIHVRGIILSFKEKAKELVEAIKETEQYQDLKLAETRVKLDPGALKLLERFDEAQRKILEAQQRGRSPGRELYESVRQVKQQMVRT